MIKKVLVGICAFSLMYSCGKDDDVISTGNTPVDSDPDAVVFVPAPVKQDWVVSDGEGPANRPGTRAWNQAWRNDDRIGIYMMKKSVNYVLASASFRNKQYTVDATTGALTPFTNTDKIYYPTFNNTDKFHFVAYSPYATATADNKVTYTFATQGATDGTDKEKKDFIFHRGTTEYSKSNPVTLNNFQHKFSKIRIEVIPGEDSGITLENSTATLTGMPASATVDLAKLAANENDDTAIEVPTGTATITPHIVGLRTADLAVFEAIVPPHSGTGFPNRKFVFIINGAEREWQVPNTDTFETGKEYKYVLTMTKDILNMHDGLSNCYMVAPGGSVEIPITRAITIGGLPKSTANEDIDLKILWDDGEHIGGISGLTDFADGNDRKFTVTTDGTKGKGNAAIKLVKDGVIYWSWHIWVVDPDEIGIYWTNPTNNVVFMDRMLGGTETTGQASYGHTYQWGRKDPFPRNASGANSFNVINQFKFNTGGVDDRNATKIGAVNGILQTIRNPMYFYHAVSNNDWLPTPQLYLWSTSGGNKGVYDPCPVGWRVPWIRDSYGTNIRLDFTPLIGIWRDYGAWYNGDGGFGLYWTALVYSTQEPYWAWGCHVHATNPSTYQGGLRKARGCYVRCVRE